MQIIYYPCKENEDGCVEDDGENIELITITQEE